MFSLRIFLIESSASVNLDGRRQAVSHADPAKKDCTGVPDALCRLKDLVKLLLEWCWFAERPV